MKTTEKADDTKTLAEDATNKHSNDPIPDGFFYTPVLRTLSLGEILGLSETKRPVEEGE